MRELFLLVLFFSLSCGCSDASDNAESSQAIYSSSASGDIYYYKRVNEPNENAFSILIPKGWKYEGGIFRINPIEQGPSNAVAAKLDFTVKKDKAGSVMVRWLPDMLYFDMRYSPAGQMGMFPQGSNYQGMTVWNLLPPEEFILQFVIPYAHPGCTNVEIIKRKNLSKLAQNYTRRVKAIIPNLTFSYNAGMVEIKYTENGKTYEERIVTVIENWGQMGAGMWGNKETFLIRAPKGDLSKWLPVLSTMQTSVKINSNWLAGELKGQIQRGEIIIRTQNEVQRIESEITEHRKKTNAEINNDMFLTLTDQEEFVNPYTKEVEMGSNQWKYRWVDENGDVIYTDKEDYDPNVDINLNRNDFKRTPIRKR